MIIVRNYLIITQKAGFDNPIDALVYAWHNEKSSLDFTEQFQNGGNEMYRGFPVAPVILIGVTAVVVLLDAERKKAALPMWLMVLLLMLAGVCFASAILAMCL